MSAVKIRPQTLIGWSGEESDEEGNSKTSPIIQSEGATFPWNIDGELVEIANEVLIRYDLQCYYNTDSKHKCY